LSLTEIVVKGKKPPVSFKIDRQIFRAAEYANAANGNAIDLIKNLPSVSALHKISAISGQKAIPFAHL